MYIITPQSRPLDVLVTSIREFHIQNTVEMVDTISNMQVYDLNSKPHGGKSLRGIIYHAIGVRLYPPSGSEQ